jgi:hypothetical protein
MRAVTAMAMFVTIKVYKEPVISPSESDLADRQAKTMRILDDGYRVILTEK